MTTVEFWLILGISLGTSLLSSYLTSPLYWHNLRNIIHRNRQKNPSINPILEIVQLEMIFIVGTIIITAIQYFLSRRISLFCGGSLVAVLCFVVTEITRQFIYNEKMNKKFTKFLLSLFFLYILFFAYDNIMFSNAKIDKMKEVSLSKEILPNKLTNSSFTTAYLTNGKMISFSNDRFILIENNNLKLIECAPFDDIILGPNIPLALRTKNPKEIGIIASNDNSIYFVYALLSKESLLGNYNKVKGYALYNAFTKEITYLNHIPKSN